MGYLIVDTIGLFVATGMYWMLTHIMGRSTSKVENPGHSPLIAAAITGAAALASVVVLATQFRDVVPLSPMTVAIGSLVGVLIGAFSSYGANRRAAGA